MKITFGLVVYNEEKLIRRCLSSIKDVADEIIVVHDGPCTDQTLAIVSEFTDQVSIRPRLGGSDPHRVFILEQAKNDWVFMIDADEFLSLELRNFLKNARLDAVYGAYSFLWPLWNGERYVTMSNYRACLFNRSKVWAIGLHNFGIQSVAPVKEERYVLEHQPLQNKVSFKRFGGQLKTRLERDARCFLQGFEQLPKYNASLIPVSFKEWYTQYVAYAGWFAYLNFCKHLLGSLKNTWRDGRYGLLVSFQAALYQFKLARKIAELKKEIVR